MKNPQTLTELLQRRVAAGGIALYDRDKPVTPQALEDESRRIAQGLYDLGVREGDRVREVPCCLSLFHIGDDGLLTFVRKLDIDVGNKNIGSTCNTDWSYRNRRRSNNCIFMECRY